MNKRGTIAFKDFSINCVKDIIVKHRNKFYNYKGIDRITGKCILSNYKLTHAHNLKCVGIMDGAHFYPLLSGANNLESLDYCLNNGITNLECMLSTHDRAILCMPDNLMKRGDAVIHKNKSEGSNLMIVDEVCDTWFVRIVGNHKYYHINKFLTPKEVRLKKLQQLI